MIHTGLWTLFILVCEISGEFLSFSNTVQSMVSLPNQEWKVGIFFLHFYPYFLFLTPRIPCVSSRFWDPGKRENLLGGKGGGTRWSGSRAHPPFSLFLVLVASVLYRFCKDLRQQNDNTAKMKQRIERKEAAHLPDTQPSKGSLKGGWLPSWALPSPRMGPTLLLRDEPTT